MRCLQKTPQKPKTDNGCKISNHLHIIPHITIQVSAVADEPGWCTASQQTCCKQKQMLSVINLRPN